MSYFSVILLGVTLCMQCSEVKAGQGVAGHGRTGLGKGGQGRLW